MSRVVFWIVVFLTLPGLAIAQNEGQSTFYGELRGGSVFAMDSEQDLGIFDTEISLETGWLVEVASGYAHSSGLRGELAVGYRTNDFDEIKVGSLSADLNGDIWAVTTLANVYYDFHLNRFGLDNEIGYRLRPFLGGGIGVAFLEIEDGLGDDDDVTMAYQGIGGLSYAFSSRWQGTLTYSYLSALDAEFGGVDVDYDTHNVSAGVRFAF